MSNEKQDKILCILSIALVTMCYAAERIIEVSIRVNANNAFVLLSVFAACTVGVCAISSKAQNPFYGLLSALIGYKMMPPSISTLKEISPSGDMFYYLLQKAAVIVFIIIIIKMYKKQKDNEKIALIPVLACAVVVPFFVEIANKLGIYFMSQMNMSMLALYFSQFAFYSVAAATIFVVAYKSNYVTFRFVACYEFVALVINILRKVGVVGVYGIKSEHISLSHYCWIAIYLCFFALFYFTLRRKNKAAVTA